MNKLTGSTLLLAALFSLGVQADDGMTLQQQRDQIGDNMVRERTGAPPPTDSGGIQSNSPSTQPGNRVPPARQPPALGNPNAPATNQQPSTLPGTPAPDRQQPAIKGSPVKE